MEIVALFVTAVLLAWTSLLYVKLRTTRRGMMWLPLKVFAGTYSLEIALIGLIGAVVGVVGGSLAVTVAYALVALAAGIPLVRTWRTPEVFSGIFGAKEEATGRRPYLLGRPWGARLGPVPAARVERDIPFWTPPERERPLLADIWQPAVEVPRLGLGFIYLHGSCWAA